MDAKIIVPENKETTALGAAFLAGLAVGFWKDETEIKQYWQAKEKYAPQMKQEERIKQYARWKDAVKRCMG